MPHITSSYRAPWWLPTGHAQSIYAQFLPRPKLDYRRERLELADGDFVDLDWSDAISTNHMNSPFNKGIAVFFHGLEGSSNSQYCPHTMREANQSGWTGVVAHFRGCSGEPNRLPRSYHSGDGEHADIVLREIRKRFPYTKARSIPAYDGIAPTNVPPFVASLSNQE